MTRHNRERARDHGRETREPMHLQERAHNDYNRGERGGRDYSFDFGRNNRDAMQQREFDQDEGHRGYGESEYESGGRAQSNYYGRDYQQGRNRGDYERTDLESQDIWSRNSEPYGRQNYGPNDYESGRGMQGGYERDYQQGRGRGTSYGRSGMESQQDWGRNAPNYGNEWSGTSGRRLESEDEGFGGQRMNSQQEQQGQTMQTNHAGRGPKSYKRRDDRIEEDVNEQLTRHHMIDATDIEVSVKDGEVTLRGTTDSRQTKRMAEDIAESVSGVKDVRNEIKVQQQQQQRQENKKGEKGDKSEKAA